MLRDAEEGGILDDSYEDWSRILCSNVNDEVSGIEVLRECIIFYSCERKLFLSCENKGFKWCTNKWLSQQNYLQFIYMINRDILTFFHCCLIQFSQFIYFSYCIEEEKDKKFNK